jgi:hypothetical protein
MTKVMENQDDPTQKKKLSMRELFSLGEVGNYFFRKKDPSRPVNTNIRVMHGINRISIIVFLLAVIYLVAKRFFD